jgi:hypothetical protein
VAELEAAARAPEAAGPPGAAAPGAAAGPSGSTVAGVVAAIAFGARPLDGHHPGGRDRRRDDTAAALAALLAPAAGTPRAIALLPAELASAEARAWLAWALGAGAALVLPAAPELVAWSLAWTRPSHAAFDAAELPDLRAALLAAETPRALRRRLRRLRHLVVWGGPPRPDEEAGWAELGVPLTPWPATAANRSAGGVEGREPRDERDGPAR